MPQCYLGTRIKQIYLGEDIKRGYIGSELFFSRSQDVTYYVDKNKTYVEEVEYGETCLSPKTFTPSKSGYTFVGWREDTDYSLDVLPSKTMDDSPISLYAIYKKEFTHTYHTTDGVSNNTTKLKGSSVVNYKGDGFVDYPTAPNSGTIPSDRWTWRGWSAANDKAANASVAYSSGSQVQIFEDADFYGLYQRTLTLSYNGNGSTGGSVSSQSGTQYLNGISRFVNPSFVLKSNGFSKTDSIFNKWALGSVNGTQYNVGDTVTINDDIAVFAIWKSYTTLFSNSNYHIGSNTGNASEKAGKFTCETPFNASNATKLQLTVSGYHNDTPTMGVYLLTSSGEAASNATLVGTKSVPGSTAAGGDTTYEFDISKFTGTRYVHITSTLYLYIRSIKYV